MVMNPMVEKNEPNTFNKSKYWFMPISGWFRYILWITTITPKPNSQNRHLSISLCIDGGHRFCLLGNSETGWGRTPQKGNITNTNRWMFKPLRVMYSKATGKPWKLWDEGPCNSSNVIICWVLPLPIVTNEGLAVGFPTKTDQNPGKGAIQTICHQQTDCLFGSWYRPSFLWNEIYSTPTNQSTVPFVTPWSRIFILEKKGPQIEETEEICLSNWLISAKTMWRFKTTRFKWIKSSPIEITFELMFSGKRVVGGFNPFENHQSNWLISSGRGEKNNFETTTYQKNLGISGVLNGWHGLVISSRQDFVHWIIQSRCRKSSSGCGYR